MTGQEYCAHTRRRRTLVLLELPVSGRSMLLDASVQICEVDFFSRLKYTPMPRLMAAVGIAFLLAAESGTGKISDENKLYQV